MARLFDKKPPPQPLMTYYGWKVDEQSLHWRHNDHDGVSNHQPHGCLLNRLFRRWSKKTSKLRVTGLCVGNSPGPVNSPHKGPVTRKMFPFDDVIMDACLSTYPSHQFGQTERWAWFLPFFLIEVGICGFKCPYHTWVAFRLATLRLLLSLCQRLRWSISVQGHAVDAEYVSWFCRTKWTRYTKNIYFDKHNFLYQLEGRNFILSVSNLLGVKRFKQLIFLTYGCFFIGNWLLIYWLLYWSRSWYTGFCPKQHSPDSKVHGANMGPIWGRQDPGGPHVGPTNLAIGVNIITVSRERYSAQNKI